MVPVQRLTALRLGPTSERDNRSTRSMGSLKSEGTRFRIEYHWRWRLRIAELLSRTLDLDVLTGEDIKNRTGYAVMIDSFHNSAKPLRDCRQHMGSRYPPIGIIPGNDDPRMEETALFEGHKSRLWIDSHNRKTVYKDYAIYGFSYIPPSPFALKFGNTRRSASRPSCRKRRNTGVYLG